MSEEEIVLEIIDLIEELKNCNKLLDKLSIEYKINSKLAELGKISFEGSIFNKKEIKTVFV